MAPISLQGRGGGRIPTKTTSIMLSRSDLAQVMRRVATDQYPHLQYGAALACLQANPNAASLIREAATRYTAQ